MLSWLQQICFYQLTQPVDGSGAISWVLTPCQYGVTIKLVCFFSSLFHCVSLFKVSIQGLLSDIHFNLIPLKPISGKELQAFERTTRLQVFRDGSLRIITWTEGLNEGTPCRRPSPLGKLQIQGVTEKMRMRSHNTPSWPWDMLDPFSQNEEAACPWDNNSLVVYA